MKDSCPEKGDFVRYYQRCKTKLEDYKLNGCRGFREVIDVINSTILLDNGVYVNSELVYVHKKRKEKWNIFLFSFEILLAMLLFLLIGIGSYI